MLKPGKPRTLSSGTSCLLQDKRPANSKWSHYRGWLVDASRDVGRVCNNRWTLKKIRMKAPLVRGVDMDSSGWRWETEAWHPLQLGLS